MTELLQTDQFGTVPLRHVDPSDGTTALVVDLGPMGSDVHVDVVGDTVIIVDESAPGDGSTLELPLPSGEATTFIRNGVLTIEVKE